MLGCLKIMFIFALLKVGSQHVKFINRLLGTADSVSLGLF